MNFSRGTFGTQPANLSEWHAAGAVRRVAPILWRRGVFRKRRRFAGLRARAWGDVDGTDFA